MEVLSTDFVLLSTTLSSNTKTTLGGVLGCNADVRIVHVSEPLSLRELMFINFICVQMLLHYFDVLLCIYRGVSSEQKANIPSHFGERVLFTCIKLFPIILNIVHNSSIKQTLYVFSLYFPVYFLPSILTLG